MKAVFFWLGGASSDACNTCVEAVFFLKQVAEIPETDVRDEQHLKGLVFFSLTAFVFFFIRLVFLAKMH